MRFPSKPSSWVLRLCCALLIAQIAGGSVGYGQSRPRLRPVRRDYFAGKFLLIPADSRPVSVQTPRLVARLADHDIMLPPLDLLGSSGQHGNPELLIEWVRRFDFDDIDGVVVSTEMLARGGSNGPTTSEATLRQRLAVLPPRQGHLPG